MKVQKITPPYEFLEWMLAHESLLPASLVFVKNQRTYCWNLSIKTRAHVERPWYKRIMDHGDIANIASNRMIYLNDPKYFSDVERLARAYEEDVEDREVTIRVYEGK